MSIQNLLKSCNCSQTFSHFNDKTKNFCLFVKTYKLYRILPKSRYLLQEFIIYTSNTQQGYIIDRCMLHFRNIQQGYMYFIINKYHYLLLQLYVIVTFFTPMYPFHFLNIFYHGKYFFNPPQGCTFCFKSSPPPPENHFPPLIVPFMNYFRFTRITRKLWRSMLLQRGRGLTAGAHSPPRRTFLKI